MRILILTYSLLIIELLPAHAETPFVIGEKHVLKSKILGEDRPYIVGLPASYNDKTYHPQQYPVLCILDREAHFHAATGAINHMSNPLNNGNMRIPEMIVVAIPNTTDRLRDLTPTNSNLGSMGKENLSQSTSGGGPKFLQFIEKELIPAIESKYQMRQSRTFVGHSLEGLTVLHSFLTQPGLFQNYIAIDSSLWWDGEVMNKWVQDFIPKIKNTTAHIFMSLAEHKTTGDFPGFISMTASNIFFAEWLKKNSPPDFATKLQVFPGQDHSSVPLLSLYYGLMHSFDGYKLSMETIIEGETALSAHYQSFPNKAGIEFLPTGKFG
ncbi:MAG: hypothetical protein COB36_09130 [Alphaproteobacteria bacterium]|nr:MAG: hypothetical protein COB36_09130 [Alphaproteobacteria bacterium]